jgi:hypothetical protein
VLEPKTNIPVLSDTQKAAVKELLQVVAHRVAVTRSPSEKDNYTIKYLYRPELGKHLYLLEYKAV